MSAGLCLYAVCWYFCGSNCSNGIIYLFTLAIYPIRWYVRQCALNTQFVCIIAKKWGRRGEVKRANGHHLMHHTLTHTHLNRNDYAMLTEKQRQRSPRSTLAHSLTQLLAMPIGECKEFGLDVGSYRGGNFSVHVRRSSRTMCSSAECVRRLDSDGDIPKSNKPNGIRCAVVAAPHIFLALFYSLLIVPRSRYEMSCPFPLTRTRCSGHNVCIGFAVVHFAPEWYSKVC